MNVIWIVADTLRREAVGAYGNNKIHTPSLNSFASKSVRFDRHYVASFPTMPARADFMTGRWSSAFMRWGPLPDDVITVGEILRNGGATTAAIVDTPFYLRDGMNYDRGFASCEEITGQYYLASGSDPRFHRGANFRSPVRIEADCFARRTALKAMQWLEMNYEQQFFLYIDTWDPHEPWNPPTYYTKLYWPDYEGEYIGGGLGYIKDMPGVTEEQVKKAYATYCGEVTMVDTWVGHLLAQIENMGLMENTAIIFTTDHGTYFNEHGLFGKIVYLVTPDSGPNNMPALGRTPLYEEDVNIPLFIYMPGTASGSYNGLTSAIDLMPTVLDIMGQNIPKAVEGKSLVSQLKNTDFAGRDYVVSSFSFMNNGDKNVQADQPLRNVEYDSLVTVTTDKWALLYDPNPGMSELYNLKEDPGQSKNVISENQDIAHQLHQSFVQHMRNSNVEKRYLENRLELTL